MAYVIGMNSGSSFDGADVSLFEMSIGADGLPVKPKFIDGKSYEWPEKVANRVRQAFVEEIGIFELTRLNYYVGAFFARCAKDMMDRHNLKGEDVEVIGLDGQTIFQEPPDYTRIKPNQDMYDNDWIERWFEGPYANITIAGEPAVIASYTGVPVVNNFRPSDHALGGTGAPTHQFLDFISFRDIAPAITLNLGGIGNIHVVSRDRNEVMGFDTGPANIMMNFGAMKLFDKPYDKDGAFAAKGTVCEEMLNEMKEHPAIHREPPRSFWSLDFGFDYTNNLVEKYKSLKPEDIMATLTYYTAYCVNRAITTYVPEYEKYPVLIASGGGTFNPTLMNYISDLIPKTMRLTTSDEFDIPAMYKECALFGLLGYTCINKIGNNIPHASGASAYTIMGHLVWPPRMAKATDVI